MTSAKSIVVLPIDVKTARAAVKLWHYSHKVVANSQLHFGVFLDGKLEGAMQFGPPLDKNKTITLVKDTAWNGFIELNRMALSDKLPRNSESRALGVALRFIKKNYPHIEWVLSFSDASQCGDGQIYRASGFKLVGAKKNNGLWRLANGEVIARMSYETSSLKDQTAGVCRLPPGAEVLAGYQFKYVYFLNPSAEQRLTAPVLPFSTIDDLGARMYKGNASEKAHTKAPL